MTDDRTRSPRITHVSWGEIEVEGEKGFKDAKLYPGGARGWNWNETGTRHSPGVQMTDIQELLDHGAQAVVLSKGMLGRLQVPDETLETLRKRNINTHVLRTEKAVELYNLLREKELVGGLFHTTC